MASNMLLKEFLQKKVEHERIFRVFLPKVSCHPNYAVGEVTLWQEIGWSHVLTKEIFMNIGNYLQCI